MHAPGVEVRPLRQMTGDAEFNEIFFENVRVPRANLLGGLHEGWQIAVSAQWTAAGNSACAATPAPASDGSNVWIVALGGGVPIKVGNETIGAVGVGGAPGGQLDEQCAVAAIDKVKGQLQ